MKKNENEFDTYFNEMFDKYFNRIFYYVLSITNNKDEASDITQECFIKLYETKEIFESEAKLRGWLFTVSRNKAIDKFRFLKRFLFSDFENHFIHIDIDNEYEDKYMNIIDTLNKLSKKHREILFLKYYEDLSYKEISEILQINEGTVMSRISRAKKKFREVIKL